MDWEKLIADLERIREHEELEPEVFDEALVQAIETCARMRDLEK